MRLQVISLPHTQTTPEYSACAYTQKVRKFAEMMTARSHKVTLYGGEENSAAVVESVICITRQQQIDNGFNGPVDYLKVVFDHTLDYWKIFNDNVIREMKKRIKPHDIICVITGRPTQVIKNAFPDNLFVEFGIGYEGIINEDGAFHVFESHAWQNYVYGLQHIGDGRFYDEVIPNYFEIDDFPIADEKEDYFLYIGRLTDRKGWRTAQDVCQRLGQRLIVAGPGDFDGYGEYAGTVGPERRGELMSRAKAVFVPTQYNPPFEGVHIEAMLSGTPVITTPFGVFQETVIDGGNGYKCHTLQEFVDATKAILDGKIGEPAKIRAWAQKRYSTEVVAKMYEKYFERLLTLHGVGWTKVVE